MSNGEKQNRADQSDGSSYNKLVVPIIIAIVAGGSAPWWVEYIKQYLAHPAIPTSSQDAPAEAASKVGIGNFYHRENGCHSSSQTGRFTIENADKLDRTRPGTIQGVIVEVYAANGAKLLTHTSRAKRFLLLLGRQPVADIGCQTPWAAAFASAPPALTSARMSTDFFTRRASRRRKSGEFVQHYNNITSFMLH